MKWELIYWLNKTISFSLFKNQLAKCLFYRLHWVLLSSLPSLLSMQFLQEAKPRFSCVTQTLPQLSLGLHMEFTFLLLPTSTFWPITQNNPVYLVSTPKTWRYLWSDFLQVIVLEVRKSCISLYFRNVQLKPVTDSLSSPWLVNSLYIVRLIIIILLIIKYVLTA